MNGIPTTPSFWTQVIGKVGAAATVGIVCVILATSNLILTLRAVSREEARQITNDAIADHGVIGHVSRYELREQILEMRAEIRALTVKVDGLSVEVKESK